VRPKLIEYQLSVTELPVWVAWNRRPLHSLCPAVIASQPMTSVP